MKIHEKIHEKIHWGFTTFSIGIALLCGSAGASLPAETIRVSADRGDDGTGDGAARPYRTLRRALKVLSDDPIPGNPVPAEVIVELEPGTYSGGVDAALAGPLSLSTSLTIRRAGTPEGRAILTGDHPYALLTLQMAPGSCPSGCPALRLEGLDFEGGLTAVSIVGQAGADFEVSVTDCHFVGQGYQHLEIVAGEKGRGKAEVAGNDFDGAADYGVDLATRADGRLEFLVSANRFRGNRPVGGVFGGEPLGAGVSIYLDRSSRIQGSVDRNRFFDTPTPVLVKESESAGDAGALDLRVSNSVMAGRPGPHDASDPALQNHFLQALYLDLGASFDHRIDFLHNTVDRARGAAILQISDDSLLEGGRSLSVRVRGSILRYDRSPGGSPGEDFLSLNRDGVATPFVDRYRVEGNLLGGIRWVGIDGNRSFDPLFESEDLFADDGYQLSAGSPALDAVDPTIDPGVDPALELDLSGRCRVAAADGGQNFRVDLGALERPGTCASKFLRSDCDGNGSIELTDAIRVLNFLFFSGGPSVPCREACDADDDGALNLTDGIYTLSFLFVGGAAPPPPYPRIGVDPTPDGLLGCQ